MNMNKEWRSELRALRRAKAKIVKDAEREAARLDRDKAKYLKVWARTAVATLRRCDKAVTVLDRRAAILEGRLG